jgi:hypothetical protein
VIRKHALWISLLAAAGIALSLRGWTSQPTITQEELVRRTQELFDAVAPGNQEPFKKYFADDAMFSDEKGRNMDKAALVKDITPLPPGYSGTIKVVRPQSRIVGETAVLSYDLDETETVFGQKLTARYHEVDTWMRRNGTWQILAAQVHRYYEDPSPGKADATRFAGYIGSYELAPGVTMAVTAEGDRLYSQRSGRAKEELVPEAADIFFRPGVEGRRLFHYDDNGKVDTLIDRRNNEDILWRKMK